MTHCRHGVPWYACAKMCPEYPPPPRTSRAGWVPVLIVALVVLAVVAWRVAVR